MEQSTTRPQDPTEALLNQAFHTPPGGSFFDDFPVWQDPHLIEQGQVLRRMRREGGKVVATAFGRVAKINLDGRDRWVGLIGAVATDPAYRGKGFATALVQDLQVSLTGMGCEFVALWGSDTEFYARLGFSFEGEQFLTPLHSLELGSSPPGIKLRFGYTQALFQELRKGRTRGLVLEESDQSWMARHKNVNWMWLEGSGPGSVAAYIGVGRGIDLPGVIHEWGGEVMALRVLLAEVQRRVPDLLLLGNSDLFRAHGIRTKPGTAMQPMGLAMVYRAPEVQNPIPSNRLWFWGLDSA